MICENIQYLRKKKNLTQEALAERVGVSRQTIVKWEGGESVPDLEMAGALARELEVSLDALAGGSLAGATGDLRGKYMFGVVTIGDKGQIVIPVQARRVFQLRPGDQLMVLGDENRGLALINAKFILEMAEAIHNGEK